MIKISVIIPIYNMEEYLPQCLDSIVSQTLREIEILCIDDGSTDGSEEVLKLYCNRDSRIRVIKQNNQGVSCARNLGIEEASGKYVIFMDPDDWYPDKEILETLYVGAEKNNVSIAGGSFMDYHDGIYNEKFPDRYFGYHFEKDGVIEYTDYQFDFGYQRFIFEKSLLTENHISFKKYVRYQDPPFFVEAMIAARRFYGVDKPAYCYRYGHTEIKWNRQKVCDLLKGISDNLQISSKYGLKKLHNLTIRRLNDEYRQLLGDSIFFEEYACDVFEEMLKTMNYIDVNMSIKNEISFSNNWIISAILYASYNSIILIPILIGLKGIVEKKSIGKISCLTGIIFIILGISLSLLLGLGQMLLQFSSFFRNLPLLASMNCYYIHPLSLYYPVWQGLGIQIVWLLIVFLLATLILIGRNIR